MRGAALVSVNIRLSPPEMAEIIRHSGASLLVVTHEFADLGGRLAGELDLPLVIAGGADDGYEAWLAGADPAGAMAGQIDERQLLAIGYYRDDEATREVTRSGCFLTGDLAVMHPDGYIEIRDRSKDIIISGGENIASVEVEQVLDSHPSVVESAVVGMPHERWGEVPVAFVTLRKDDIDADALTEYARERLARYKVPKRFEFCELPKTSTGKTQKNVMRDPTPEL